MLGSFKNFLKTHVGSVLIETCFALPIVLTLTLYILELMKINTCKSAIDAITQECTYEFIKSGSSANFDSIIKKHVPGYINYSSSGLDNDVRYNITLYTSLEKMSSTSPYGGSEIAWLTMDGNVETGNNGEFLATTNSTTPLAAVNYAYSGNKPQNTYTNPRSLAGYAFVLTFVCRFRFSSPYIAKMFSGGSNTRKTGSLNKGKIFMIWGRGVGICS